MGAPRSVRGSGGGGGAKKPAAKPANGKAAKQEDLFDDEVDQFHADRAKARDHISLGDDDGSDDEDDEDDERLGDTYGLDGDDDEDEGEDDDSDDDDIDERFKPPTGGRMNLADDDDEGDGEEEDDRAPRKWGSKKSAYYGADDVDAEDSEDVEEDERADKLEEEEARRLQAAQLGLLQDDDFDDGQALGDLAKRAKAKGAPKPAARPRAGSALAALDDAFDTVALRGEAVAQVERRGRAADGAAAGARKRAHASNIVNGGEEGLSAAERLEIVTRDAPELLELLADLKAKLDETRSRVAPLVEAAHSGELKISGGLGYLETKLQLLLSYCTHLAFFLALKASGMKVREHPVVPQLVRLRAILEKLGPLDKKLRFQVDRLLQLAVADEGKAAAAAARPNPRALIAKGAGGMDGELEEEEEGEARKGRAGSVGIYRPPKLAAVEYDGDLPNPLSKKARKAERDQTRRLERASRSALVRELRNEFGDEPEELAAVDLATGPRGAGNGAAERLAREEDERRQYEEDHFVRLQLTKKQKKAQRALAQGGLDSLERIEDLTPLLRDGAMAAHAAGLDMDSIVGAGKKKGKRAATSGYGNDDDDYMGDMEGLSLPSGGLDGVGGGGEDDEAVDEYEEVAQSAKARKRAKSDAKKAVEQETMRANAPNDEQDGEKRSVGYDIVKNKGLTRKRKKLDRNARVKNREKFRRAVIKRKGQVRDVQSKPTDYGGEATGIKKNVTHSRRFA